MSFIDMEITRQQFAARYVNVGRAMLGTLADMYGIDIDIAEHWADAIDREADQQIAVSSTPFDSAVPTRSSGASLTGAACTAAPGFSPFPSRRVATRFGRGGGPCAAPTEQNSRS